MAELRLVGVSEDGARLVLADDDGNEHTVVIDERIRAGVHGHLSRLGQLTMALESRISPREIQNRVRGGESAEHVAQTAGVPLERVLRFVGPVLREREHVADQARRARLAGANGPTSLLGDLVSRTATRRGIDADDVTWDSARREDHTWVVTATLPDGTAATWSLDLLRHVATPLDPAARRMSGVLEDASEDAAARDVPVFPDIADSPDFDRFDADSSATPSAAALSAADTAPADHDAKVHRFVPRAVPDIVDDASSVVIPDAAVSEETAQSTSTKQRSPGRSSRRAKVPTWDDIMFGMKPKD